MKIAISFLFIILLVGLMPSSSYASAYSGTQPKQIPTIPQIKTHYTKGPYQAIINKGISIYVHAHVNELAFAQYLLLYKINLVSGSVPNEDLLALKKRYRKNPFIRLIDSKKYIKKLRFQRDMAKIGTDDFYTIPTMPEFKHTWDPILLRALYCDKTGYDDKDFQTLMSLRKNVGQYEDTHYLLALLFLKENHCYNQSLIQQEIVKTGKVISDAESRETSYSDIYAERIVMLYWAGLGGNVQKAWIDKVATSFSDSYGWDGNGGQTFNDHASGLSLLALLYYTENKPQQKVY